MKPNLLKKFIFIVIFCMFTFMVKAQVTIGSGETPSKAALLDLKETDPSSPASVTDDANITSTKGGLVLSRVKLVNMKTLQPFIDSATEEVKIKHAGLTVYNIYESPGTVTDIDKIFSPGTYTWDGTQWKRSANGDDDGNKFFYLPSFNLSIDVLGTKSIDLYNDVYLKQFNQSGNSLYMTSNAALTQIPAVYEASQLDFVVIWYDDSVITVNGISTAGVMSYTVKDTNPPAASFINIVLVKK